jgi:hypothetical protein
MNTKTKTAVSKTKLKAAGNLNPVKPREIKQLIEFNFKVYIKDKGFKINCGDGKQKLRWLIDVALHLYERPYALTCGPVIAIRFPDDTIIQDFNRLINTSMLEFNTVFIMLKDDFEDFVENNKKNRGNLVSSSKK